jgi:hypothetical protein
MMGRVHGPVASLAALLILGGLVSIGLLFGWLLIGKARRDRWSHRDSGNKRIIALRALPVMAATLGGSLLASGNRTLAGYLLVYSLGLGVVILIGMVVALLIRRHSPALSREFFIGEGLSELPPTVRKIIYGGIVAVIGAIVALVAIFPSVFK